MSSGSHHHHSSQQQAPATSLYGVVKKFSNEYGLATPKKCKVIDAYLTYILLTGVIQFAYCCLVGTFPFNAFLSGFISCVGSFVLAVCLRLQVSNCINCSWSPSPFFSFFT